MPIGLTQNCDADTQDCRGTTDETLGGSGAVDIWKTVVIGFWACFNTVFFLKYLLNDPRGFSIRM